jgi:CHAD domain-containing protein
MDPLAIESSVDGAHMDSNGSVAPYTDAIDAARILLSGLTDKLNTLRDGVINNLSTESLHDFRITIRKIRCLLAEMDGILPEPGLTENKDDFRKMMDKTGLLRDLEVCIQMLEENKGKKIFANGELEAVLAHVHLNENKERKFFINYLKSEDFKVQRKQWKNYLDKINNVEHALERSKSPIRLVSTESICLRYLKTVRQAIKVSGKKNTMEKIHELRKSGKKLRYLIDLFSDLYPEKTVKRTMKELKKFQDCLGRLQDLEMQAGLLTEIKSSLKNDFTNSSRSAINHLIEKQEKLKTKTQKKAIKLVKRYPGASRKTMGALIQI